MRGIVAGGSTCPTSGALSVEGCRGVALERFCYANTPPPPGGEGGVFQGQEGGRGPTSGEVYPLVGGRVQGRGAWATGEVVQRAALARQANC